jgi:hypothetical protein
MGRALMAVAGTHLDVVLPFKRVLPKLDVPRFDSHDCEVLAQSNSVSPSNNANLRASLTHDDVAGLNL